MYVCISLYINICSYIVFTVVYYTPLCICYTYFSHPCCLATLVKAFFASASVYSERLPRSNLAPPAIISDRIWTRMFSMSLAGVHPEVVKSSIQIDPAITLKKQQKKRSRERERERKKKEKKKEKKERKETSNSDMASAELESRALYVDKRGFPRVFCRKAHF